MRIEHNYSGTPEYAYQQIDNLLASLQKQHREQISKVSTSWNKPKDRMNYSFKVYGFTLTGVVEIHEGKVVLEGKVPLLARAFQDKAETLIRGKLEEIL